MFDGRISLDPSSSYLSAILFHGTRGSPLQKQPNGNLSSTDQQRQNPESPPKDRRICKDQYIHHLRHSGFSSPQCYTLSTVRKENDPWPVQTLQAGEWPQVKPRENLHLSCSVTKLRTCGSEFPLPVVSRVTTQTLKHLNFLIHDRTYSCFRAHLGADQKGCWQQISQFAPKL